jgi:hypothetical protein
VKLKTAFSYVSAQDFLCQSVDLPRLSAKDREGYIRMRLARYFPDPLADNPVSLVGRPRGGKATAVFTSHSSLESYRRADSAAPLACILSLCPPPPQGCLRVVLGEGWAERAEYRDGSWGRPDRLPALESSEAGSSAFLAAAFAAGEAPPALLEIFHLPENAEAARALAAVSVRERGMRPALKSLDQALRRLDAKRDGIFMPAKESAPGSATGKANRVKFLIIAVSALALAANALIAFSSIAADRKAKALAAELGRVQAAVKEELALREKIKAMDSFGARADGRPSVRHVLSALAAFAPASARIREFMMEDGRFTAVMEADDALAALQALEASGTLGNLSVSGIQPQGGSERFTLRGSAR